MSIWTVAGEDATAFPIDQLKRTTKSWAEGSFTFRLPGRSMTTANPFSIDQIVTLARNGTAWLTGPVVETTPTAAGESEFHTVKVSDAWHWLANTTYLQTWQMHNGRTSVFSSRVIVGMNQIGSFFGEPLSMEQAVELVLGFARSCGLPVAAGTINLPGYFKVAEMEGASCMKVIQEICRWQPDAVAWWTYGGGNALLNIVPRANLTGADVTIDRLTATNTRFTPRQDLVPNAVVILYEQVSTIDGHATTDFILDAEPSGDNGAGYKKLHFTVPMQGIQYRFLKERLITRTMKLDPSGNINGTSRYVGMKLGLCGVAKTIPGTSPAAPYLAFYPLGGGGDFFKIQLADANLNDDTQDLLHEADAVSQEEQAFETAPNSGYDSTSALENRVIVFDDSLVNELVHGKVRPWMAGIKAQKWTVTCRIGYYLANGTFVGPVQKTFNVMATNAVTRLYTELEGVTFGETVPTGVAAQLYSALSVLDYEGSVQITSLECDDGVGLGNALNVFGGAGEWGSMNATIQSVTDDIDRGISVVTVGPPKHLDPGTLMDRYRALRSLIGKVPDATRLWQQVSGYIN